MTLTLDVEAEEHDVAVGNDVVLPLTAHLPCSTSLGIASTVDVVLDRNQDGTHSTHSTRTQHALNAHTTHPTHTHSLTIHSMHK